MRLPEHFSHVTARHGQCRAAAAGVVAMTPDDVRAIVRKEFQPLREVLDRLMTLVERQAQALEILQLEVLARRPSRETSGDAEGDL